MTSEAVVRECEFFSPTCEPRNFWIYLGMVFIFILTAGMMAGLTLGLLSLDKLNMTILQMEGTPQQRLNATKILSVINHRHFLLVTLLLVNAGANEALPIFLNGLVPETTAILISVTCVLIFGEILPAAIFSGPNQVSIAASLVPFVKVIMAVTSPLAYPLGKLIDCVLGEDEDLMKYKRNELKALVTLQRENQLAKEKHVSDRKQTTTTDSGRILVGSARSATPTNPYTAQGTMLHIDEVTVIHGALDLATKTVTEIMTPWEDVYALEDTERLNRHLMADIMASGHSRIPIYRGGNKTNIVGILIIKRLIVLDPDDERPISDIHLKKPIVVNPHFSCYGLLNEFQKGRSHLALLTHQADYVRECWAAQQDIDPTMAQFLGIVTLEDVVEELIQEEIEDESDIILKEVLEEWKVEARRKRMQASGVQKASEKFKELADQVKAKMRTSTTSTSPPLLPPSAEETIMNV